MLFRLMSLVLLAWFVHRRGMEVHDGDAKIAPAMNHFCKGTDDGMRQLGKSHASFLTGTDVPALGTSYGGSVHGELALFLREGLMPLETLAAATSAPAKCFHLSYRGAIRPALR